VVPGGEDQLGKHFIPHFTGRPLEACLTSTIRTWLADLPLEESTKAVLFVYVNSMFDAAVDDRLIRANPCQAKSLKKPRAANRLVVPWNRAVGFGALEAGSEISGHGAGRCRLRLPHRRDLRPRR
jgi:hypothetical protein